MPARTAWRDALQVQAARRRHLELDHEVVESDGATSGVGADGDARRYGVGESEVVGRRHAVNEHSQPVAPRQRVQHNAIVRSDGRLVRRLTFGWSYRPRSMRRSAPSRARRWNLVDGVSGAEMGEVRRHPDPARMRRDVCGNPLAEGIRLCPIFVYRFRTTRKTRSPILDNKVRTSSEPENRCRTRRAAVDRH